MTRDRGGARDYEARRGTSLLGDMVGLIPNTPQEDERIRFPGFLQVRKRTARGWAAIPATGEANKIEAGKKVAFRCAKGAQAGGLKIEHGRPGLPARRFCRFAKSTYRFWLFRGRRAISMFVFCSS
jgi:nucleoid DNA-binding protein